MIYQRNSISNRMLSSIRSVSFLIIVWFGFTASQTVAYAGDEEKAQTVVHMLDYVSVDYPKFIQDGVALNPSEYEEQLEFTTQAGALLKELPSNPQQVTLLDDAAKLRELIVAKADGVKVSASANGLRLSVIQAYQLTVAPKDTPDLNRAAQLFAANCMACHGATGHGDGQLAANLDPKPSNFHDEARMRLRSIYGLYNTITLGVGGTPMRALTDLPEDERWALAFYVSSLRLTPEQLAQGSALWEQGKGKTEFSDLKKLVTLAPAEIEGKFGHDIAHVGAFLTAHPDAIKSIAPSPIALTRSKLVESLQAYQSGDKESARQLAISAYLEGFELIENSLSNVDKPLRLEVEKEMMSLRASIAQNQPTETIDKQIKLIDGLLESAETELSSGNLSPTTAFVSSLLILLREGLEAVLVLAAISAFIAKTGRRDALPYFHLGWIIALVLGALTWLAANYLLTISGAGREMTEGITAMIAAAMLLYIGYWLHTKSNAKAWQHFLRSQVSTALDKRTLWAMAGVSFLAVYRELFETILFYEALWAQAGPEGQSAVLSGIAVAAVLLALMTWIILRYSVRLPIGKFFSATAWLLIVLAVVFIGNGVAALQEAGVLNSQAVNFISVPLLGVYPTLQGLSAQLAMLILIVIGLWLTRDKE
ncbi:MAG: FTR1 family protein [Methylophilaceae bacterium]